MWGERLRLVGGDMEPFQTLFSAKYKTLTKSATSQVETSQMLDFLSITIPNSPTEPIINYNKKCLF